MSIERIIFSEEDIHSTQSTPDLSNVIHGKFLSPPPDQPARTSIDPSKIPAGIFPNTGDATEFLEFLSGSQEFYLKDEPIPPNVEFISSEAHIDHFKNGFRVEVYLNLNKVLRSEDPEPPTAA